MIYTIIAGTDRTADIERGSLKKNDELQERADTASLRLIAGARPSQNQEVKIFDGDLIVSLAGTALVIGGDYTQYGKFRAGDEIWLGLGESTEEKVTIASISGAAITLTAAAVSAHAAGEKMGRKIFGGTVQRVDDENRHSLANIIQSIECTDYTKIFDKKLVNDSWKDRSTKYIIVDFLNTFINYNALIDAMEYATNGAIQTEWIESGDGTNPTTDSSDYKEGDYAGVFPWTNSGGAATFSATPASQNIADLTGAATGAPASGVVAFWYKQADNTAVTDIRVRIGSDSSNFTEVTLTPAANNSWNYARLNLADGAETGTPNWKAVDYAAIVVNETASSSVKIDGLRVNATNSFTFDNVSDDGVTFEDFRAGYRKPTDVMQTLADQNQFFWYIDYDRDIHFFPTETNNAPFGLTATSNNFNDLSISLDASKIVNRQTVRGATETSSTKTQQDIPGDGTKREWSLRNKFRNLSILTDTGGGFATQSVAIEFIYSDTGSYRYFSNFNAQSARSGVSTSTLASGSVIRFRYHEIIPIITQAKDNASITALKSLLGNDGIFDGRTITDKSLKSRVEAEATATAEIAKYSNPIITANFSTNYEGLRSGQLIRITDSTTGRNIDQNFVIQKVKVRATSEEDGVNEYDVKCASTVFGIIEFLQKIIRGNQNLNIDENEVIFNTEVAYEEVSATESWSTESQNIQSETVTATESWTPREVTPPFVWKPTGGSKGAVWNLFSWSSFFSRDSTSFRRR